MMRKSSGNTIDEYHIPFVIDTATCPHKTSMGTGEACWYVITSAGKILPAVCNTRAVRAGLNGSIDPNSLAKKGPRQPA